MATGAFNTIKAGFAAGREIESMAGDLGRWMGAVSDIKKAEEYNKKPPIFKKLFQAGSVEEEAMQIFMAKKKAEDMRSELKQIISFTRGPSAWEELLKTEGDIRKKRQKAIYDQEERRRKLLEGIAIALGIVVVGGFAIFIVVLTAKARGIMQLRYAYKDYVFVNDNNKGILYKAGKLLFMGNSWSAINYFIISTDHAQEVKDMFKSQLSQRQEIRLRAESKKPKDTPPLPVEKEKKPVNPNYKPAQASGKTRAERDKTKNAANKYLKGVFKDQETAKYKKETGQNPDAKGRTKILGRVNKRMSTQS